MHFTKFQRILWRESVHFGHFTIPYVRILDMPRLREFAGRESAGRESLMPAAAVRGSEVMPAAVPGSL